jgi:hypothetical protein
MVAFSGGKFGKRYRMEEERKHREERALTTQPLILVSERVSWKGANEITNSLVEAVYY